MLAQSLYFQNRGEDAVQELGRVLDELTGLTPADATFRMRVARRTAYLALVLAELGAGPVDEDRERVAALAAEAAEFPPADHVRDVWLAEALELTGEYGAAERVARRAIAAAPDRPEPWRQLGRALLGLKDYRGGSEAFAKVLESIPDDPEARFIRALAHLDAGREESAMQDFRAVLARPPGRFGRDYRGPSALELARLLLNRGEVEPSGANDPVELLKTAAERGYTPAAELLREIGEDE